jgi:hypothetical protein
VDTVAERFLRASAQPVEKRDQTNIISERSRDTRLSGRGNEREAVRGALL